MVWLRPMFSWPYKKWDKGAVMPQIIIDFTNEEEKALLWDVATVQEWVNNVLYNKARQCADEICKQALEDKTHTILTLAEKRLLRDWLDANDIVLTSVKQLPVNIKRQVVAAARVKSAVEREAEREAEL